MFERISEFLTETAQGLVTGFLVFESLYLLMSN